MIEPNHSVFFCCGTGGSFIDSIFLYYTHSKLNLYPKHELQNRYLKMSKFGDCHDSSSTYHFHDTIFPKIAENIKKVCIKFNSDDYPFIIKMAYDKLYNNNLEDHEKFMNELLSANRLKNTILKNSEVKKTLFEKLFPKSLEYWLDNFQFEKMDLILDFKTVYGKNNIDLHETIVNFLQVERCAEVDEFINQYRKKNNSLYFDT